MATTFKIGEGASQFNFIAVIDASENLISIVATDAGGAEYDCALQLEPLDNLDGTRSKQCCRPPNCTAGTCSQ